MRRTTPRPPRPRDGWAAEDGISISEMLVALFLLAVSLAALAAVIVSSVRSVSHNEREVDATAIAVEVIEELQTLEWDVTVLYSNEIEASSPVDGIARWRDRLSEDGTLNGDELTLTAAYSGSIDPDNPERDVRVPWPTATYERGGHTYHVDRYITWVDKDGDGTVETKRFTVATSWLGIDGDLREITTAAERVPTQSEATTTNSGVRVILFAIGPDPAELDKDTAYHLASLDVTVWTNAGVTSGALTVPHLDSNDDDLLRSTTMSMTPSEAAGSGWSRWDTTISPQTFRFWNGQVDLSFSALAEDGTDVTGTATLNTFGGPVDSKPGGTASSPDPEPSPTSSPSPAPEEDVTFTGDPSVDHVCVRTGSWKLRTDTTITAHVEGLAAGDEEVTVTYRYYSTKTTDSSQPPDEVSTDTMVRGDNSSASSATYTLTIPRNTRRFEPGGEVTFHFDARRQRDGQNSQTEVTVPVTTSC